MKHEVRSPYSGEVVGEVDLASREEADRLLGEALALFADRKRWLPAHRRIEVLRRAAALARDERERFASLIAREGGKPLVDGLVEVDRAASGLDFLAGEVEHLAGEQIPMGLTKASEGRIAFTVREPIGVVLAISAFNHPLNLIVHQVGPAVAVGCPVIVKPALETPLTCLAFLDLLGRAGLDEGHARALVADNEVAAAAAADPRIAYLSFIGSAAVGWGLRRNLAPGVRIGLEHGGAAPVLIDEGVDLDAIVPLLLKGAMYHAGQVCVSIQRVFAHRSQARELSDKLSIAARALRFGDPELPQTEIGPLIRSRDVTRIDAWVREAEAGGAAVLSGGSALERGGYAPTVLFDPPAESRVMQLEVFGPVVSVCPVADLDEAISRANLARLSFQASVFSRDLGRALRASRLLDASTVLVNDPTTFRTDWMPFGGRRESGLGMGGMPYSVRELTQSKLIVLRA